MKLKSILKDYEKESVQLVNFQKSAVSFNQNTKPHAKLENSGILEMTLIEKYEKYLGLATMAGRSKNELFTGILDRIRKKLKVWKEKTLSAAAREVLIKSVAQAQLTYVMSVFKVPDGVIDEAHNLITNFWWGHRGTERRAHWVGERS
ncbi:unnamed protein product [Linum trigynum]|uniref:Reverse transcriptase n=1 Tax=Linum trigynum TaxID=586398 RepID=A0AAV2EBN1_9ROSI